MLLQNEIVGVGRRLLATLLDLIILHLALSVVTRDMHLSPTGLWLLDFVIAVCYSAAFVVLRGQTPGKIMLRLRVISAREEAISYGQAFSRAALKWMPVFGVFVLLALLIPEELRALPSNGQLINQVEIDPRSTVGSSIVMVVGSFLWIALIQIARRHPDGQGLHDRIAKTYVIRTP